MGFFDGFPFTNTHTLNLDWILGEVKKIPAKVDEAVRIAVSPVASALDLHVEDVANPHNVTLEQVGGAPSGFGLGGYSQYAGIATVAELDNFVKNGKFCVAQTKGTLVLEGVAFNALGLEVSMTDVDYGAQIVRFLGGQVIRRIHTENGWQPWEWENPPMALGVEYRTTERWNGKAVYTKLINFGALPNATIKMVNIGLDASQIFNLDFKVYNGAEMCSDVGNHVYNCAVYVYNTELTVIAQADMSAFNGFATLRYTKD